MRGFVYWSLGFLMNFFYRFVFKFVFVDKDVFVYIFCFDVLYFEGLFVRLFVD